MTLAIDKVPHCTSMTEVRAGVNALDDVLVPLLVQRSGEVVTRDDVLAAWRAAPPEPGQTAQTVNSNALEVYVHRLRKKLDQSGLTIRNIRGLGYLLEQRRA